MVMDDQIKTKAPIGETAARGVVGGFFGCFGVLAAIVVAVFALIFLGNIAKLQREGAEEAADRAGSGAGQPDRDAAAKWASQCAAASVVAKRSFIGAGVLQPTIGYDPWTISPPPKLVLACPGHGGGYQFVYAVAVVCEDLLAAQCYDVRSVTRDGVYLKAR